MSKTPFKTPAPSEFADDPIEPVSSPPRRLRDCLPGVGSSVEPSFAMDDSQKTRIIEKTTAIPKAPANPLKSRFSYSFPASSDYGADDPTIPTACKLPDIEPGPPVVEAVTPAKGKKTDKAQKVNLPKRSTRNKKMTQKAKAATKKPATKEEDAPAAKETKEAALRKEATPQKRPLLSRMLSVLSEPGSMKWDEPLIGSRVLRSPSSDEPSSPLSSVDRVVASPSTQQDISTTLVDLTGGDSPSIPASFAEPLEISGQLGCEKSLVSAPTRPVKNQVSPIIRFGPLDPIDPNSPRDPKSKPPTKGPPKAKPSPVKRARETQKAAAPPKRRRVQEPVKKRVVQPKSKAKAVPVQPEMEDEFAIPVVETREPERHAISGIPRTNSRTVITETGSPTRIQLPREATSPIEVQASRVGGAEKEATIGSPMRKASATQPPVNLKSVFQSQATRPRVAAARIDRPREQGGMALERGVETTGNATLAQQKETKATRPTEKMMNKEISINRPGGDQQVSPTQQNPAFEVFRKHILSQLTTLEARQQDNGVSSKNSDPASPEGGSVAKDPVSAEPPHILRGVLQAVTEVSWHIGVVTWRNLTPSQRTLGYVRAKEKYLDEIVEEYETSATAFIDRVEKLHQIENSALADAVKKQRQSFVDSCKNNSQVCDRFMENLEQYSISGCNSKEPEEWLEHSRDIQREMGN